ncbi:peptidase, partial [Mycoplasmopsis pullorum]
MVTQYIIIGVSVFIGLKLIVLILWKTLKIVSERDFYVVERLGKYNRTLTRGIRFLIPFFEKIVVRDNIKEKVFDFPAQSVITKDNATIKVDTVVYLQITDPKLFAYGAEQPFRAI